MKKFFAYSSLALSFFLAACSQTPPSFGEDARLMSGILVGWTGEEAQIQANVLGQGTTGSATLVQATVDADGAFTLTLPATVDADYLRDDFAGTLSCEGLEISSTDVRYQGISHLSIYDGANHIGVAQQGFIAGGVGSGTEVGDFLIHRLYVDEDVTVSGTCESAGTTTTYDLDLREGWNTVVDTALVADSIGEPGDIRSESSGAPADAKWYVILD